jgi:hypothetical protein
MCVFGEKDWKVNHNYDCIENRTSYAVNRNLLDSIGGLYSSNRHHSLYPDRKHEAGSFYFAPINRTNLFLLVAKDFSEDAEKCPKLNRFAIDNHSLCWKDVITFLP